MHLFRAFCVFREQKMHKLKKSSKPVFMEPESIVIFLVP